MIFFSFILVYYHYSFIGFCYVCALAIFPFILVQVYYITLYWSSAFAIYVHGYFISVYKSFIGHQMLLGIWVMQLQVCEGHVHTSQPTRTYGRDSGP